MVALFGELLDSLESKTFLEEVSYRVEGRLSPHTTGLVLFDFSSAKK